MVVTRGDTHNFHGMRVTLPDDRTVHIDTIQHVKESIEDFGEPPGHPVWPRIHSCCGACL